MDRRIIASTTSAGGGYVKAQESISLLLLHELFSSRLNPIDPAIDQASGTSAVEFAWPIAGIRQLLRQFYGQLPVMPRDPALYLRFYL